MCQKVTEIFQQNFHIVFNTHIAGMGFRRADCRLRAIYFRVSGCNHVFRRAHNPRYHKQKGKPRVQARLAGRRAYSPAVRVFDLLPFR